MRFYLMGLVDFLTVAAVPRGPYGLGREASRLSYNVGFASGVVVLFALIFLLSYLVSQFASWVLPC
jgi:hypothetical protein